VLPDNLWAGTILWRVVARIGRIQPGGGSGCEHRERPHGQLGRLIESMSGDHAFDLIVLHVRRFDVDQAYLASDVLQWLVNEIAGDSGISECSHVGE